MLPHATEDRTSREEILQGGRTKEIQRIIGRALRAVVDLQSLGERTIRVDCDVIQADGGTRTMSITGGFIALVEVVKKLKRERRITTFPLKDYPGAISVGIVGEEELLDLTYIEDARAGVDMNICMTGEEKIVEIQATAEGRPFSSQELESLLSLARKGINQIIEMEKEELGIIINK